jgi:ribosome-associated protein
MMGWEPSMVRISDNLEIPDSELSFRYARSSGPGGQNVNKVATKVTLLFPVFESAVLSDDQKRLVGERLGSRISKDGLLHVTSERHRTRSANQRDAVERFVELVATALRPRKRRRATRVPESSRRRRLEGKRRRSERKRLRGQPSIDE